MSEQRLIQFPSESRLQRRYRDWRLTPNGQGVFRMLEQAALDKAARGESFGIASLAEELRHDQGRQVGRDGDGFKVNNSFRSLLARELVLKHPPAPALHRDAATRRRANSSPGAGECLSH